MNRQYTEYALVLKALADETRLKIASMLMGGELCACKILEAFEITQPTLSHHMKMLEGSGLVRSRRDGVWKRYSLEHSRMNSLIDFLADISKANPEAILNEGGCDR